MKNNVLASEQDKKKPVEIFQQAFFMFE